MRHALRLELALAGFIVTGPALASESPPRDPASAEVLFREGRSLVDLGNYVQACPKFAESLRLDYAPGTLLNLADCEEHTGKIATAWAHFDELSTDLPPTDERQPMAVQRAKALEPRLPHLTIRSSAGLPFGLTITRDDVELGRASLDHALPIDPGVHTVVVRDGARERSRVTVEMRERQSRVLAVDDEASATGNPSRTAGWIAGGLALTAFGTGTYFGVSALSDAGAASAHCTSGVCDSAASARNYDDARSQARISDVALGIGVAATVVSGILFFSSLRKSEATLSTSVRWASLGLGRVAW